THGDGSPRLRGSVMVMVSKVCNHDSIFSNKLLDSDEGWTSFSNRIAMDLQLLWWTPTPAAVFYGQVESAWSNTVRVGCIVSRKADGRKAEGKKRRKLEEKRRGGKVEGRREGGGKGRKRCGV